MTYVDRLRRGVVTRGACALTILAILGRAPGEETAPPRVLLTPDVVARIRNEVGESALQPAWAAYLARVPHHDVTEWHFAQYQDLVDAAFIATIAPSDTSVRLARCLLELACTQEHWSQPGNEGLPIDLYAGATAMSVALAYDWLYDELDARERRIAEDGLERLAFRPFLAAAQAKSAPFGDHTNNWCALINSGVAGAAAVMQDRSQTAREVVPIAEGEIVAVLDRFCRDGGWAEGLGYFGAVVEHILLWAHVLHDVGTACPAVEEHPALARAVEFALAMRLGDGAFIDFSDSSRGGPSRTALWRLASMLNDGRAQWLAEQGPKGGRWLDLVWHDEAVEATPPGGLRSSLHQGIGWAVLRSGWDDNAVVCALASGFLTGHSHLDANHVLLHAFGETLLTDPGIRPYTDDVFAQGGKARYEWTSTGGHNTILMDDLGQRAQRPGEAGRVAAFMEGPHCSYVLADATAAYSDKARAILRHVLFVDNRYFVIVDDLAAEWPAIWEARYHTRGAITIEGHRAVIAGMEAGLVLDVAASLPISLSARESEEVDPYVSLLASTPGTEATLVTVAYPHAEGLPDAPLEKRRGETRITNEEGGAFLIQTRRPEGLVDTVAWNATDAGAEVSAVTRRADGSIAGFSAIGRREMAADGQRLFNADAPVNVSARVGRDAMAVTVVAPDQGSEFVLAAPARAVGIRMDGQELATSPGPEAGTVAMRVPAGSHRIEASLAE